MEKKKLRSVFFDAALHHLALGSMIGPSAPQSFARFRLRCTGFATTNSSVFPDDMLITSNITSEEKVYKTWRRWSPMQSSDKHRPDPHLIFPLWVRCRRIHCLVWRIFANDCTDLLSLTLPARSPHSVKHLFPSLKSALPIKS